jgi:hypothetical protein
MPAKDAPKQGFLDFLSKRGVDEAAAVLIRYTCSDIACSVHLSTTVHFQANHWLYSIYLPWPR